MMLLEDSKRVCQSLEPLHLDNLPSNLIDVILMCLPLRDAVRTSILSKKWRYNWCKLPQLTLDRSLWQELEDVGDRTIKFTKIVCNLLTYHPGPITKFTLSVLGLKDPPMTDNLIYFLSRNGIQHLNLHASRYRLPSSFFTCSQMRHLILYGCVIHPPPNFKGFDRLISLELFPVNSASSQVLESFISHCPMLEQLGLRIPGVIDPIKISAPKLRSFRCTGYVKCISLKNCPLLLRLSLVDKEYYLMAQDFYSASILKSLLALEHLHLGYHNSNLKFLAAGTSEVPKRLPYDLNCLKHLSVSLGDIHAISCALCLIRSSPYLQHFEFKVFREISSSSEIPSLFLDESCSDVTLNHLRSVKLIGVSGTKPEMQLIKFLLSKSPVLVTMLIELKRTSFPPLLEDLTKTIKVLAEITRFRRASPIAEVVYSHK